MNCLSFITRKIQLSTGAPKITTVTQVNQSKGAF